MSKIPMFPNKFSILASLLGVIGFFYVEQFTGGQHWNLSFPFADGFAVKFGFHQESYILLAFGNSGTFSYKYVWNGDTSMAWKRVATT